MGKGSTINVQNSQKEWLKKYVEIGKLQLQKSIEAQNHLKSNIFSRISNRQEIRNNDEYIHSLSGALAGVETQQELYLHKPIELTAPSMIEEPLLQGMVQGINDKYNEKIQEYIKKVTLENFEKTYQEYRGYELDLSNMKTATYMKNQTFPSLTEVLSPDRWEGFILDTEYGFDQWEGEFYALPTTKDYPDKYVMSYLENQNSFQETGDIQYSNEAESIRATFSSDTLKKINEFVEESIEDYKTKVSRFFPFEYNVNPTFKEVDRLKDYLKFPKQSIILQENKEKKDQFVALYDSLPKEEQLYLNTYNEFHRELLSNEYSDTVEGRSYQQRDLLKEQASNLDAEQVEKLKEMYREYISTSVDGAELDQLHMDSFPKVIEEWKGLQVSDQESLVTTLSQLTTQQREYLENVYLYSFHQEEISHLSEVLNENEGLMNYSESQLQSVASFEKEGESILKQIDQIGEISDKRAKEIETLKGSLTAAELDEVDFIFGNVEHFEYEMAIQAVVEIENETQELAKFLDEVESTEKDFSKENEVFQDSEELLTEETDLKKIAEQKALQNQARAETIHFGKHERFLDFYNQLNPDEKNFVKALNDKQLETYFMHEDFIFYETDDTKSKQYEKVAAEFPKERVIELETIYHATVGSSFNWSDKETTIHDVYSIIGRHPETTFTYQEQMELDPSKFIDSENPLKKESKKDLAEETQESGSILLEKEEVIDLYAKFLQGESLTYDERSKIVAYDQKNNSFEQMQYRLEAIDVVQEFNPEINLSIQEEALCQTRGEQKQMLKLVSAEYYQQSTSEKKEQKQEEKERKEQKKERALVQQLMM
ncbi:hypothetical protein A5819_003612 [Enterococcus sp. 7E2_DIV0204]|uniref:hypothetical protein n=1 Tax=unclassified Enterococcus TaxID=2608891 RepID=UPI000A347B47|nr:MULTISPECIES: hypothetical protein [unclassified Enterococcus]OTN84062.1 hypothetical protein A5819_003612 [Enterococcus sp. 7E2_DIV0204]OTP47250.1 hypothetical protein A5884_003625 [Enterococcus sp. 7D2_DIV0200]